ncbi:MAG: HNH endonuclease [Sulfuritalea sp.]|nr:HNH endonuclease [Sulfuritalea sp.]
MATITLTHIKTAFDRAADVFDGKVSAAVAAKQLNLNTGLNESSAKDFFAQYRRMLQGEVFKRSLSAEALQYFLPRILATRGRDAADRALSATWQHIAYYESLGGTHLNRLRSVATNFQSSLPGTLSAQVINAAFEASVAKSQNDSAVERKARLAATNPVPTTQTVTATVFRRNADVVAEVLARANGICEGCKELAPFKRRSDNSPFLEVHHRKPLADGGHDTVENAIALCPNCHRKAHYG